MLVFLIRGARYANALDYFGPNLTANELVVHTPAGAAAAGYSSQNLCVLNVDLTAQQIRSDEAGVRAIASSVGTTDVLSLQVATGLLIQTSNGGTDVGLPYVATPQLLAHYGIRPGDIRPGAVVLSSRGGLTGAPALQLPRTCSFENACPPASCIANPAIQTVPVLPPDTADPNLVVTPYAVHEYGPHAETAIWLVHTNVPLTAGGLGSGPVTDTITVLALPTARTSCSRCMDPSPRCCGLPRISTRSTSASCLAGQDEDGTLSLETTLPMTRPGILARKIVTLAARAVVVATFGGSRDVALGSCRDLGPFTPGRGRGRRPRRIRGCRRGAPSPRASARWTAPRAVG